MTHLFMQQGHGGHGPPKRSHAARATNAAARCQQADERGLPGRSRAGCTPMRLLWPDPCPLLAGPGRRRACL
ncbi:hypothetical protein LLG90_06015 [Aromatoleum toluclasticum]|nr:hypothetical protein [Aromatoleum toluclasticum]